MRTKLDVDLVRSSPILPFADPGNDVSVSSLDDYRGVQAMGPPIRIDAMLRFNDEQEKGQLADFVILGKSPRECEPRRIKDIPVEMTVIGDQVDYERSRSQG